MDIQSVKEGLLVFGDLLDQMVAEGNVEQLASTIVDTLAISEKALFAAARTGLLGSDPVAVSSLLSKVKSQAESLMKQVMSV